MITFNNKKYKLIEKFSPGACGETFLVEDVEIKSKFVLKKLSPIRSFYTDEFYERFITEIKLLHLITHENIVRIFNYEKNELRKKASYLMEYVDGKNIEDFIKDNPTLINKIFLQVINGFSILEDKNIVHRDIRKTNILVRNDGIVKIIDFGFSKEINADEDIDKSISLNWWCKLPSEFNQKKYDSKTEIYFIGKLFEKVINDTENSYFKFENILNEMIKEEYSKRIDKFINIKLCLEKTKGKAPLVDQSASNIKLVNTNKTEVDEVLIDMKELMDAIVITKNKYITGVIGDEEYENNTLSFIKARQEIDIKISRTPNRLENYSEMKELFEILCRYYVSFSVNLSEIKTDFINNMVDDNINKFYKKFNMLRYPHFPQ